ncbi:hypothetical protein [Pseudoxanthomonas sp. PXM01]|uniref:hypothetical protein n=1 Tax=Pseudoxanthomonas sp. PXM01 TaxID=2769295 RepID=UPI00178432A6|nr:hypothetical protein [Pseudoxanthomonas sp. PXM01]MBD9467606.1 hypothetical protein [Pseudoxanthomonas sp. PXM01]
MNAPRPGAVLRIAGSLAILLVLIASVPWLRELSVSAKVDRDMQAERRFNEAAWPIEAALVATLIPRTDFQCSQGELKVLIVSSGCASRTALLIQGTHEGSVYYDGLGDAGYFIDGTFRRRHQASLDAATVEHLKAAASRLVGLASESEFNCGMPCFEGGTMVCVDGKRRAAYSAGFERKVEVGSEVFYQLLSAEPGRDPAAPMGICI